MSNVWHDIDFPCEGPRLLPLDATYSEVVSPVKTADSVRAMAMDHFPDGPAAAAASQAAYLDWQQANAGSADGTAFLNTGKHPEIAPEARRWQAFVNSWEDHCTAAQTRGRVYAKVDLGARLDLSHQAARMAGRLQPREKAWRLDQVKLMEQAKSGSWRERRPSGKPSPGLDKGKGRGRSR